MNAIITLGVVMICAAGAGWLAYRGMSGFSSRLGRAIWSAVVAFFVLGAAWMALSLRTLWIPTSDNAMFSGRSTLELAFTGTSGAGIAAPKTIAIGYPDAIRIDEDAFTNAALTLDRGAVAPPLQASLISGGDVSARSLHACDTPAATPASGANGAPVKACERKAHDERGFQWIVRSAKPGVSMVTINLPAPIVAALGDKNGPGSAWSATVAVNGGSPLTKYVHSDGTPLKANENRVDMHEMPITLTQGDQTFHVNDVDIDLGSGQITFPLRFETTMGVSAGVYDLITQFGALASAVLGGGWLWQFLAWRKARAKSSDGGTEPDAPAAQQKAQKSKAQPRRPTK
ncbi:hypothetical protein [Paraburkholderia sediminicola]|uniref:hypothetical protein n=1 Tax=Paraburkholderia sediminicola TaxID=458836 RepID=UPI0038B9FF6A